MLQTDFFEHRERLLTMCNKTFFTGPIDQYFQSAKLGKLEYRSIKFQREILRDIGPGFYQAASVVNYPSLDYAFTRIVEYKHFLYQTSKHSIIVKEFSTDTGEPYYPVPNERNRDLYSRYKLLAEKEERKRSVYFVGRLANYKYFNMDQAIENALDMFDKIEGGEHVKYRHAATIRDRIASQDREWQSTAGSTMHQVKFSPWYHEVSVVMTHGQVNLTCLHNCSTPLIERLQSYQTLTKADRDVSMAWERYRSVLHNNMPVHSPGPQVLSENSILNYSRCELELLGWAKYREMGDKAELLCDGFSTIVCPTLPEHSPRRAYFCVFRNLLQECDASGMPTWVALCRQRIRGEALTSFLAELPKESPLRQGHVKMIDQEYNMPSAGVVSSGFTYIASGDCMTGNPGHCMGDSQNFYIVRTLLGLPAEYTEVQILNGFGSRSKYSGRSEQTIPLIEDWKPFVSHVLRRKCVSAALLPFGAFSTMGMHSPHWRGHKDPVRQLGKGKCQGRSQVLIDLRRETQHYWTRELGNTDVGACQMKLPSLVRVWNHELCSNASSRQLLYVARGNNSRSLVNDEEIMNEVVESFQGHMLVSVDLGRLPFVQQYSLVQGSWIVFGMHGSGMSNAARWMDFNKGHKMLEIMPVRGPGSTCAVAKLMGIQRIL